MRLHGPGEKGSGRLGEGQAYEVAAHSLTAVLGVWLGLTVASRSRLPAARVFAVLALAVAVWSSSVIVRLLSSSDGVRAIAQGVEEVSVALAVPWVALLALIIASEGHPSRRRAWLVVATFVASLLLTVPTLAAGDFSAPALITRPFPEWLFALAWIASRLGPLVLALAWLLEATRRAEPGGLRRRQLIAAVATVATAAAGAGFRVIPVLNATPAWVGVSLVTLAVVLAAYTVFAAGIFLGPAVASRAFWGTLVGGVAVFGLATALLAVEAAVRAVTGVDVPAFTVIALVVTVALYDPIAVRVRGALGRAGARDVARSRLLRALGRSSLTSPAADAGINPAVTHLLRSLQVDRVAVVGPDGTVIAEDGRSDASGRRRSIPLEVDDEPVGELQVTLGEVAGAFGAREELLLQRSAAYLASALSTSRREEEQLDALAGLSRDLATVDARANELHAALVQHAVTRATLTVRALGSLHVDRDGAPMQRWGGDKAGTRQAEGLFAFLLDRGERGIEKDEAIELIWPDADIGRADLAFHRTMVGLRQTLDPGRGRGANDVIRFVNDRYRLDQSIVSWWDVGAFLGDLDAARDARAPDERRRLLEQARVLYRGEYLDDCPFYGTSLHVEDRRQQLRARFVDLLIALGETYEGAGDRMSAAAAFREAIQVANVGCPPAEAGLVRLASAASAP